MSMWDSLSLIPIKHAMALLLMDDWLMLAVPAPEVGINHNAVRMLYACNLLVALYMTSVIEGFVASRHSLISAGC